MLYSRALRILLAAVALIVVAANPSRAQVFGVQPDLDPAGALTVTRAVQDTAGFGTAVIVTGTVADVCSSKGCWMVVTDGTTQMRVTFKDYGFFVPKDIAGRTVVMQGVVSRKVLSEAQARHYAEEAKTGPRPEEINGPQNVVTMVATGVILQPK